MLDPLPSSAELRCAARRPRTRKPLVDKSQSYNQEGRDIMLSHCEIAWLDSKALAGVGGCIRAGSSAGLRRAWHGRSGSGVCVRRRFLTGGQRTASKARPRPVASARRLSGGARLPRHGKRAGDSEVQDRPPSDEYLLRKLLYCERCGARMHGTRGSRPPARRYICSTRRYGDPCGEPIVKTRAAGGATR